MIKSIKRLTVLAMAKEKESSFNNWLKFMLAVVASQANLKVPKEEVVDEWYEKGAGFASDYNQKRYDLLRKHIYDHEGKWEQFINNIGKEIKDDILPVLESDNTLDSNYIDLIKNVGGYCRNLSESPLKNIMQKSNVMADPKIGKMFTYEINTTQDKAIKRAVDLARKILGKETNEPRIDASVKKKLKEKYKNNEKMLELIKEQTKAYSEINNIYKKHLANIIRKSGKPYLPIEEVRNGLKAAGIKKIGLPRNFKGFVDDTGALYTEKGLKLAGNAVGYSVTMNPDYDPEKDDTYVCSCDGDGSFKGVTRLYTERYKNAGRKHKFELVEEIDETIDDVRAKWLENVHRWTGDLKNVASLELEVVYNLASRIGSTRGNTDGKKTYGTSTWLVKHIHFGEDGNTATISYIGKKGQRQKHKLDAEEHPEHKLILDRLKKLVKNKEPNDYVFTDTDGHRADAKLVNSTLKEYGCPGTIHKLRHVKGSRLAKKLFKKSPFDNMKSKPKQSEVDKWVKKTIEKVGKQLGHQVTGSDGKKKTQWSTSMQAYIRPSIVKDFYIKHGFHIPKFLERLKEED